MIIFLIITSTTNYRASVGAETDTYRPLTNQTCLGLDIFSNRGKWMPRPEYTFLSWSYICEVFVAIFSLVASNIYLKFNSFFF